MPVTIVKKAQADLIGTSEVQNTSHFVPIKGKRLTKKQEIVLDPSTDGIEDEFQDFYRVEQGGDTKQPALLTPPYNLKFLAQLLQQNNALNQIVTAMEVNIDGTGWDIESVDDGEEETDDDKEANKGVMEFFAEVFPGVSWMTVRRKLRRDQETVGNSYLEILRSIAGNLTFLKPIDGWLIRMVQLDDPVPVQVEVRRFGKDETVIIEKRERRYARLIGSKLTYFKEYAASRDLHKETGQWHPKGSLPPEERGTELIQFMPHRDSNTPYGLPRWINNTPSVLGSREAEEFNLEFFNSGGMPPVMIFVQGGELTERVRKQITTYLAGRGSSKFRGGVIEVNSTGGDLNTSGNVRVSVERFGSERIMDSMFENYDKRCEERVRGAFRLPPMFVGKSEDYNFATAFASYTVAEAQVFQPERQEFDEIINNTIMKEIAPGFRMRSKPLSVNDVKTQLEAVTLAKDALTGASLVEAINELLGLSLHADEDRADQPAGGSEPSGEQDETGTDGAQVDEQQSQPAKAPTAKAETIDPMELVELANEWAAVTGGSKEAFDLEALHGRVKTLTKSDKDLFDAYVTMRLMSGADHDFEGAVELTGAASTILAEHRCGCGTDHE